MNILGADLPRPGASSPAEPTLVLLGADGGAARVEHPGSLTEVAATVGRWVGAEPFLLGVDLPVLAPPKATKARPVEGLVRRRLGFRLPPGGRATLGPETGGLPGEALLAGLATAGQPCLPYPDRGRRRAGLLETYPELILRALLWRASAAAGAEDDRKRAELFRGYATPAYRGARLPARTAWADKASRVDVALQALGAPEGFDLAPARDALARATDDASAERAGGVLDALLVAGTARLYLESPEETLFVGDRESGYVVLPADEFVRGLGADPRPAAGRLFPRQSLRQRLGDAARLRPVDLIDLPGRPQRLEAMFESPPRYEFDNLDEMIWWKHTRHVEGPTVPTEGLHEMTVRLTGRDPSRGGDDPPDLKLVRSRHRTLSYRFDPPEAWRRRVPTRDGRTYGFEIVRALYETAPAD